MTLSEDDPYARWGRWFASTGVNRTLSAYSTRTFGEHIARMSAGTNLVDARRLLAYAPGNTELLSAVARQWSSKLSNDPTNRATPDVNQWLEARRELSAAYALADRLLSLDNSSQHGWRLKALVAAAAGLTNEAKSALENVSP
jgi:hypothetical protein